MIDIHNDGNVLISVAPSANSLRWKNKDWLWSQVLHKLSTPNYTNETYKEFMQMPRKVQGTIKDVGGYVGGHLRGKLRGKNNVLNRQLLTLDIDFADIAFWDDFTLMYDYAACIHGTHKHSEDTPKFRFVLPMSRELTVEEYEAVARKFADSLDIEQFDSTTFQPSRLMFWPSTPKDQEYYFEFQDGPWLDPDIILNEYEDWHDLAQWPRHAKENERVYEAKDKQENPKEKKGLIGAFCRTYSISEAIDKFLSDEYVEAGEDRYTYTKGTTSAGLVVYDDEFAYSHHGTDPCSGLLSNAYDLVRLHKFGHLDENPKSKASLSAMNTFVSEQPDVKETIGRERISAAKYDFSEDLDEIDDDEDTEEVEKLEWLKELEVDAKGKYLSSATNLNLIFANDARLKGAFKQNDFDTKRYIVHSMPWRKVSGSEVVKNVDYSGIRNYIESVYGINGSLKIDDSLALEFERQSFHPVKDYLLSLEWDGKKRVDTLLIDLFSAEDNIYHREAIRKMLVGAVARVMNPGVKFDLVLTLVSQMQGTGKSSFFKALGREFFSDSFLGVSGNQSFEQLQGAWIIEMAELKGLKNAEVESVKHFISKQEDTFRPAYARVTETYKRQCVFVASTNETQFLRDPSGNRRFMPVDIKCIKLLDNPKLLAFLNSDSEISQVWAEALNMYRMGETLYLSKAAEAIASNEQKSHSETDERSGIIEEYLNTKLPEKWDKMSIYDRRLYLDPESFDAENPGSIERQYVCVAEIWCEALTKEKTDMDRYKTKDINNIMKSLDGWEQSKSTKNFPIYGKQRYYVRVE